MNPLRLFRRTAALFVAVTLLASVSRSFAQSATGSVEGRVVNPATGEYLERARVTVEGTAIETFTDADGAFRLANLPAGTVRVRTFFTGFAEKRDEIAVTSGQVTRLDVSLAPVTTGDVVKLDEFVVGASREMTAAAIAINEQRFAPNIKTVVSTDEFGTVAEGNVAEFLKFVPGITITYAGGTARGISIDGAPQQNVPLTLNGFDVATAASATGREAAADMVSINTLSRIEVEFAPTPESQGAALAGAINMIPRSSFERSRPLFNYSVYAMARDNAFDFDKTPGPRHEPTRKVLPGFDASYIVPVNKRFGFTVSAGHSSQYSEESDTIPTWRGAGAVTNGNAFPNTTVDQPYLSTYGMRDGVKFTSRNSVGVTLDYKLTDRDKLSFTAQTGTYLAEFNNRQITFNVVRVQPGDFSLLSTHGAPGAGNVQLSNTARNRANRNYMGTAIWRHDGPVWKLEGGAANSYSYNQFIDVDQGMFQASNMQRTNVTVSFDNNSVLRPGTITVKDGTTGAVIDPYSLSSYTLNSVGSNQQAAYELRRSAYGNARHDFLGSLPLTLKGGLDVRQAARDSRNNGPTWNFAGPDRNAAQFLDTGTSQHDLPYAFPRIQWTNNVAIWDYYKANPSYFTSDPNTSYRSLISTSKYARETIGAGYVRGDLALFQGRLKLVGGLRAEQTNIDAEGPLTDPTRDFQRDASGKILRAPNGTPLLIVPTNSGLPYSQLTFIDRGTKSEKEYLRYFPSLNGSFNVRQNLIARAAYSTAIGRPSFNQYAGGLTLPDLEAAPSNTNRIAVNNAGIKPWSAKTVRVRLEYYFPDVGQISVGAFRRDFRNFFGGTVFKPTPEFLALYGIDPAAYGAYDVSTQYNIASGVRVDGVDLNYKQALTFLPHWARGVQVFGNVRQQHLVAQDPGVYTNNNHVPRSGSWGVSFTRSRFNTSVNWNYRGRLRGAQLTGAGIEPGTYNYDAPRLYTDVNAEFNATRHVTFFLNIRNINDVPEISEIAGPNTPAMARQNDHVSYGALWTFGIKGKF